MKKLIAAAAAALVVVVGFVALTGFRGACGAHHGRDPARMAAFVTNHVDDALDDLNATPDQRTRVHAIKDRLLADVQKAHAGHDDAHAALLAEWKAETPDAAKLHALVDARVDEMRALAHEAVDAGVEVHGILTPEQREKITKKAERWHR